MRARNTAPVDFAQGAYGHQFLPLLGHHLRTRDNQSGFVVRTYNEPPSVPGREVIDERVLCDSNMFFIDYDHPKLEEVWYVKAEGLFTPEDGGLFDFGLCVQGTAELFIDQNLIVSNFPNQRSRSSFLGNGTVEEKGSLTLEEGRSYNITIEWGCSKTSKLRKPGTVDFGKGGLRFGACKRLDPIEAIDDAVQLASSVRQAVLFAGLSGEWETEGQDRAVMDLPPYTDTLISKVLDANPNTVVVIQSGTPVHLPWIYKTKAVLHAWYGGNETGHGIADVIYGVVTCLRYSLRIDQYRRNQHGAPCHQIQHI